MAADGSFVAGTDTVSISALPSCEIDSDSLQSTSIANRFILLMALNPEIQQRTLEEIDRVVGQGSLPTFKDREHLVYVKAIITELLRWHNVLRFYQSLPIQSSRLNYV